ncbi:MAG: RNA 2',3'-cyclic phosphodiesterase [Candidatus Omnitrophica bacterium]|nr:RNA 2',3'-cyclic phosphodiesterase [Candidatus Omnitrophota bacterium]
MRCFVAVALPQPVRDILRDIQADLKSSGADVRWVGSGHVHLTLKFMGDLNPKKLPLVRQIIHECAGAHTAFSASLHSLGTFPPSGAPRVIWMGIDEGKTRVVSLAEDLQKRIAVKAGIPQEKRHFLPHITIGRIRSMRGLSELSEKIQQNAEKNRKEVFTVDTLLFMKSTLTPQGPVYETLQEASLIMT